MTEQKDLAETTRKIENKKSGSTSTMWVSAKIPITSFPQIITYPKRAGGCKTAQTWGKFLQEKMKNENKKTRILAFLVYRDELFLQMQKSGFSFLIIFHFSLSSGYHSFSHAPPRISSEISSDSPDREGEILLSHTRMTTWWEYWGAILSPRVSLDSVWIPCSTRER